MSRNKFRDQHIEKLNRRQQIRTIALCIAIILAVIIAAIILPHFLGPEQ